MRAGEPHDADSAPGSDEINRAYEEGWVGNHALAFIGDTLAENGDKVPELFIVDLPQDEASWKQPGGSRWPVPQPRCPRRRRASVSVV